MEFLNKKMLFYLRCVTQWDKKRWTNEFWGEKFENFDFTQKSAIFGAVTSQSEPFRFVCVWPEPVKLWTQSDHGQK